MPEAAISGGHADAPASDDISAYNVKRIGDELSVAPPTGSPVSESVDPPPR
jgi:hypothetical protein